MSDDTTQTPPLRIVVGVDMTDLGDHALDEALRYARPFENAEIHPVHVVAAPVTKRGLPNAEKALAAASMSLRARVVDRCEVSGAMWDQYFSFHTRLGEPAAAIEQVAVDVDADLIVVGTHGRRGLAKMLIGSVAETLVARAHCPVLVARPKQFEGLEKSAQAEAPRPGETITSDDRVMQTERLRTGGRGGHIGGLI